MISSRTIALDTVVLAELMKPRPAPAVMRWTNAQPIGTLAITAVSLAELTYGMVRMSDLARSIDLRQALEEFVHDDLARRVLPFDGSAAEHYAEIAWAREQEGTPIAAVDAQVAAICRAHGVALATRHGERYAGIEVALVDPWSAGADGNATSSRSVSARAGAGGAGRDRHAAVERLRRTVVPAPPTPGTGRGDRPILRPGAPSPPRRAARLRGPLVDADGHQVERMADDDGHPHGSR